MSTLLESHHTLTVPKLLPHVDLTSRFGTISEVSILLNNVSLIRNKLGTQHGIRGKQYISGSQQTILVSQDTSQSDLVNHLQGNKMEIRLGLDHL